MAQLKSTAVMGNLSVTGNMIASKIIKHGGTASQILLANGDVMSAPSAGLGTVTSVAVSNGGGLSVSGSPITTSGTITISHADTSSAADLTANGRTNVTGLTFDGYGHVTGYTVGTESVSSAKNGKLTIAADGTGLSVGSTNTFTANQSGDSLITITLGSDAAGNRAKGAVVISNEVGEINSEKYTITSGSVTKATWQYNSSTDCIELVW